MQVKDGDLHSIQPASLKYLVHYNKLYYVRDTKTLVKQIKQMSSKNNIYSKATVARMNRRPLAATVLVADDLALLSPAN